MRGEVGGRIVEVEGELIVVGEEEGGEFEVLMELREGGREVGKLGLVCWMR